MHSKLQSDNGDLFLYDGASLRMQTLSVNCKEDKPVSPVANLNLNSSYTINMMPEVNEHYQVNVATVMSITVYLINQY